MIHLTRNKKICFAIFTSISILFITVYFINWNQATAPITQPDRAKSKKAVPDETKTGKPILPSDKSASPPLKITRADTPEQRLKKNSLQAPPLQPMKYIKPDTDMDFKNPPQWSKGLILPVQPGTPPDPFKTPPIKVNPKRIADKQDVPKLNAGEYKAAQN
jgi:hypothetical protein